MDNKLRLNARKQMASLNQYIVGPPHNNYKFRRLQLHNTSYAKMNAAR
jgi:hypothetical protein